jgi:hypothetical protein
MSSALNHYQSFQTTNNIHKLEDGGLEDDFFASSKSSGFVVFSAG